MALYHYRAKSGPDKIIEGEIEASSKQEAIKRIEDRGYFPIKIQESSPLYLANEKAVSPAKITMFTRQLSTLLKSGVPILKALDIIIQEAPLGNFKAVLTRINSDIKEGQPFSSALAKYPKNFSHFYTSLIKAGEDSGSLDKTLARIAVYREKQHELAAKIKVALVYPTVMGLVGLGTIIFMLTFVIPKLMNIFLDIGTDLPLPTKIIIALSNTLRDYWVIVLIGLVAAIFFIKYIAKTKEIKKLTSFLSLNLPLVKRFVMRKELARFSRTLETLLHSGISILKALELTIPVLDNAAIKQEFSAGFKDLEEGVSFGASLKRSRLFPPFVTSLILVGEESGRLDSALGELADTYERELEETLKIFTTLLEPIMILAMGLVVGFVVMAMLLPIFQINIMIQ